MEEENVIREPGTDIMKARHKLGMMRRIVMGEELGLEGLAAMAHRQWTGWMNHLFLNCTQNKNGSITIPAAYVEHLQRQMTTSYENLSEEEKESDRVEARKVLSLQWLGEDEDSNG